MNPAKPKSPKKEPKTQSYSCKKVFSEVYQFKITLEYVKPMVWRRIQIPSCSSFWDLHCAITDSLGWLDYHLHQFKVSNPKTQEIEILGIPDNEGFDDMPVTLPEWTKKVSEYLTKDNPSVTYEYDFGDSWDHQIVLEEILPKEKGVRYPRCIGGENACPPEDCGGSTGYERFKKSIAYHNSPDHDEMLQWVGGWFDPAWFDINLVQFADPKLRWGIAFRQKPIPKNFRMKQYHNLRGAQIE
jgi:hypothetical protein